MVELKKQTITRKVDINRMARNGGYELKNGKLETINYYSEVKRSLKAKILPDTELLIIKIIPVIKDEETLNRYAVNVKDGKLVSGWLTASLMDLQREFTSVVTLPENSSGMSEADITEFEMMFNCTVLRG